MRSAFVLGGTGQTGRLVCGRLAAAGWGVTAGARGKRTPPERVRRLLEVDCRTVEHLKLANALCRFVELAEAPE